MDELFKELLFIPPESDENVTFLILKVSLARLEYRTPRQGARDPIIKKSINHICIIHTSEFLCYNQEMSDQLLSHFHEFVRNMLEPDDCVAPVCPRKRHQIDRSILRLSFCYNISHIVNGNIHTKLSSRLRFSNENINHS